jgi:hypothetical protein
MSASWSGVAVLAAGVLSVMTAACSTDSPIVLRSQADRHIAAASNPDDPAAAQCQQVRDQIHSNQESLREAPTTSISPEIVSAAQGHADQRIEDLRNQLDSLGCNDNQTGESPEPRLPPMQAAPNAPNR